MTNAICERIHCVAGFQTTAWDALIPAVNAGAFDVIASGMTIAEEREKQVDFRVPYESVDQAIAVKSGDERLALDDFTGSGGELVLGAATLTTCATLAETLVGRDRLRPYDSFDGAVQALLDGDVDGVVLDEVSAGNFVQRHVGQLAVGVRGVSRDNLGLAVAEGDPRNLLDALDAGIEALRDDGTMAVLQGKWF